ncbi:efflux RND transporter periplasmic adaptor subunit [Cohnella nanjingensis]|uniref:Efflux RND transporter periplasmic adaptor subunit n=1 Tax=Cohnella nanjingensis TaxID=1387779 RepID=A0A7X0VE73_9BACL|nr:efflux RND transporter periplasmic adaptor subunit [Cohnella nanjingensis]MBB6669983.1 efflux RND transporter periplasmic adaptor subunit [Cohnella nanjingensis]
MIKRKVRNASLAFVLLMIVLTLFSNTLLQFTLPQVSLEQPGPGTLNHTVSGSGTIAAAEVSDLYADPDLHWPVDEVKVKVGDRVKAGDTLVTFDIANADIELADETARYRQLQLSLDGLREDYVAAQHEATDKQTLRRDIERADLDMQIQQRKIDKLRRQLAKGDSIQADVSGIVTQVNVTAGLPVQGSVPAVRIADLSLPRTLTVLVPREQAKYLVAGDEADITVGAVAPEPIPGKIAEIRNPVTTGEIGQQAQPSSPDAKEIVIEVVDNRLKGGEYAEYWIGKRTKPVQMLLSNDAVRENADGNYVLVLKQKSGVLGNEFYVQEVSVVKGDADESNTEIKSGIGDRDKVIASSSAPVSDGDRVRLAD